MWQIRFKNRLFIILLIVSLIPILNMFITNFLFYLMFEPISLAWIYDNFYSFTLILSYGTIIFVLINIFALLFSIGCAFFKKISFVELCCVVIINVSSGLFAFYDFITKA